MKTYVKPQIKMEFFALSESIATSCGKAGEENDGMDGGWLVRAQQEIPTCYAESSFYPDVKIFSNEPTCNYMESEEHCYSIFSGTAVLTLYS